MNYELAKQLKDAGFKQGGDGSWDDGAGTIPTAGGMVYHPTLEELIEACGADFWELVQSRMLPGKTWIAVQYKLGGEIRTTGATPTEAVANLYLALNKN